MGETVLDLAWRHRSLRPARLQARSAWPLPGPRIYSTNRYGTFSNTSNSRMVKMIRVPGSPNSRMVKTVRVPLFPGRMEFQMGGFPIWPGILIVQAHFQLFRNFDDFKCSLEFKNDKKTREMTPKAHENAIWDCEGAFKGHRGFVPIVDGFGGAQM